MPCMAMVMNLPSISGQPKVLAAHPMNQVPKRQFHRYRHTNSATLRQKLLEARNVTLRFMRKLNEPEQNTAMAFAVLVARPTTCKRANTANSSTVCRMETP